MSMLNRILKMLNDNAKVLKKKTLRNMPLAKRRKLLRSSRLDILYGRQRVLDHRTGGTCS